VVDLAIVPNQGDDGVIPCEKAPAYTIDKAKKMATTLDIT